MRGMMRHVEETAAAEGLHYDLANGVSGNTLPAHELIHLAAERGLQGEVKERLLHAHFEEGRSVYDVDSLAALAVEAGLDEAEVRAALADHRYRPAVLEDARTAQDRESTRLNSSHANISYAVFCLKKKKETPGDTLRRHGPALTL